MKRLDRLSGLLLVAMIALSQSGSARAGFVIETVSTGPTQNSTDFSMTLAVPKFDTSLGTLSDIVFSYVDGSTISGSVTNSAVMAESFTITESTVFNLSLGSNLLLTNKLLATQGYTNLLPGQGATFGTFTPSGSAGPLTFTSGGVFDAFLNATGPILLNFATLTTTRVVGGGGNNTIDITTTAGATVTVRYDYADLVLPPGSGGGSGGPGAATPEPASLVMTALGGLIVASTCVVRKRNRARA